MIPHCFGAWQPATSIRFLYTVSAPILALAAAPIASLYRVMISRYLPPTFIVYYVLS